MRWGVGSMTQTRPFDGQRAGVNNALAYIDKTIDNVVDVPASTWRSDEVIEMLGDLRAMLDPFPQVGQIVPLARRRVACRV